jgi:Icc-related predicted phosphoesterase
MPMSLWFFASDLHGQPDRYRKLFQAILDERPAAVLLGGDLLPPAFAYHGGLPQGKFIQSVLRPGFAGLKYRLADHYPRVFLILGNDDPRSAEAYLTDGASQDLWRYIHNQRSGCGDFTVYGYACIPPTPFSLKDWERFDVSRYIEPGCISPAEGWRSVPIPPGEALYATIQSDLEKLADNADLSDAIFLFHAPPYRTVLDQAALDGKTIDSVPLDVHVGSIAIRRFIEARQPWITLHGHVHESARLNGAWQERIDRTLSFTAAHDGSELALVCFDPAEPENAWRELI